MEDFPLDLEVSELMADVLRHPPRPSPDQAFSEVVGGR
jgi:hypothetical protein